MARIPTEKGKISVVTDDGNQIVVEGVGAFGLMKTAFMAFSPERRVKFMAALAKLHEELLVDKKESV